RRRLSPQKLALLEQRIRAAVSQPSTAASIPRLEDRALFPLSFGQERQWFLEKIEPGNVVYNCSSDLRLIGRLNVPALQKSLNEIIRRHDALRASFPSVAGRPQQRIAAESNVVLEFTDVSHLPPAEREAEAVRHVREAGR